MCAAEKRKKKQLANNQAHLFNTRLTARFLLKTTANSPTYATYIMAVRTTLKPALALLDTTQAQIKKQMVNTCCGVFIVVVTVATATGDKAGQGACGGGDDIDQHGRKVHNGNGLRDRNKKVISIFQGGGGAHLHSGWCLVEKRFAGGGGSKPTELMWCKTQ